MVAQLPPELHECIVNTMHPTTDRDTLLACCLAASVFRLPCQRQLFSYLNISATFPGHSYAAVAAKIEEFPALAQYCTKLWVALPSSGDLDSFQWGNERAIAETVLCRLTNVREGGLWLAADRFLDSFVLNATQWLLNVFRKHYHQLTHFKAYSLLMTPTLLEQLLGAAPYIDIKYTELRSDQPLSQTQIAPPVPLTRLSISGSEDLCSVFDRPAIGPYLQFVDELVQMFVETQAQLTPCFAAAMTLERLECHFTFRASNWKTLRLPAALPRLQCLTLGIYSHDLPPLLPPLIRTGVPALAELRLKVSIIHRGDTSKIAESLAGQAPLFTDFDAALVVHRAITCVVWSFSLDGATMPETAQYVASFTAALAQRLPNSWARGLLAVDDDDQSTITNK
ncbi:hypothetical protein MIND_00512400 [Mycena indigotica]|uniref:Uncharacterized protein n=1 Tax=Mycena indigotica TaxID=2126181 RepID=A0A8H6WA08_9AGAR|nr:uncharacterized protein MIND_00512400 [Mycena indigotica]KAF7307188.1 hypothetical protein MIND_00512400 [Mycena indigotica]